MTKPRKVARRQLRDEPYLVWNAFVDLVAEDYRDFSENQRAAHLVFWYEAEVQNGGHLQYFENRGTEQVGETISALKRLGATCQADVLYRAVAQLRGGPRKRIASVQEYADTALKGEFDAFDKEFGECDPQLDKILEKFLAQHQAEFVMVV